MKNTFIFMLLSLVTYTASAQSFQSAIDGITKQNMGQLDNNLSSLIELSINSKPSTLRKAEAIKVLGEYLHTIQPQSFQSGHQGNLEANHYQVGTLSSVEGKHRLFLFRDTNNGLVKEIRLSAVK